MKDFIKDKTQSDSFLVSPNRVYANASSPVDDEQVDEFDPTMHGRNGTGSRSKALIIIALIIAVVVIIALFIIKKKQNEKKIVDTPPAEIVGDTSTIADEDSIIEVSYGTIDDLNKQSLPKNQTPGKIVQVQPGQNQPMEVQFTPEERTSIDQVKEAVTAKRAQVETLYRKATAIKSSTGVVKIMLNLSGNGRVADYSITKVSGDLSDQFMRDLYDVVKKWSFNIKTPIQYEFQYRLSN